MPFAPPWRDPAKDPPEEYSTVLVTTETDRVISTMFYKGKFSGTHARIKAWMPMPAPAKELRAAKRKSKEESS